MRAARILQMLLLLQNKGRLTSRQLSERLEVTPRTILRDVDALTEAGLPIIVFQGNQGGIELGFGYRTQLTGLEADEAEALALVLSSRPSQLAELGMANAAHRACLKIFEAMPDAVRHKMKLANERFSIHSSASAADPRVTAIATAIRHRNKVIIRSRSPERQEIHPVKLEFTMSGWQVTDQKSATPIPLSQCADINISALTFPKAIE
jgi:predicted DNA-binding transcriptional regulator YafY